MKLLNKNLEEFPQQLKHLKEKMPEINSGQSFSIGKYTTCADLIWGDEPNPNNYLECRVIYLDFLLEMVDVLYDFILSPDKNLNKHYFRHFAVNYDDDYFLVINNLDIDGYIHFHCEATWLPKNKSGERMQGSQYDYDAEYEGHQFLIDHINNSEVSNYFRHPADSLETPESLLSNFLPCFEENIIDIPADSFVWETPYLKGIMKKFEALKTYAKEMGWMCPNKTIYYSTRRGKTFMHDNKDSGIFVSKINLSEPKFDDFKISDPYIECNDTLEYSFEYPYVIHTTPGEKAKLNFHIDIDTSIPSNQDLDIKICDKKYKDLEQVHIKETNHQEVGFIRKDIELTINGSQIDKPKYYWICIFSKQGSKVVEFPFIVTDRPRLVPEIPEQLIEHGPDQMLLPINFKIIDSFDKKLSSNLCIEYLENISESETKNKISLDLPEQITTAYNHKLIFHTKNPKPIDYKVPKSHDYIKNGIPSREFKYMNLSITCAAEYIEDDFIDFPFKPFYFNKAIWYSPINTIFKNDFQVYWELMNSYNIEKIYEFLKTYAKEKGWIE